MSERSPDGPDTEAPWAERLRAALVEAATRRGEDGQPADGRSERCRARRPEHT